MESRGGYRYEDRHTALVRAIEPVLYAHLGRRWSGLNRSTHQDVVQDTWNVVFRRTWAFDPCDPAHRIDVLKFAVTTVRNKAHEALRSIRQQQRIAERLAELAPDEGVTAEAAAGVVLSTETHELLAALTHPEREALVHRAYGYKLHEVARNSQPVNKHTVAANFRRAADKLKFGT